MAAPRGKSKEVAKAVEPKEVKTFEVDTITLDAASRMGRPATYKAEFVDQAKKLCELGATDMELAEFFNVSDRTIYRWQNQFADFCQALKAGKEAADDRVERSLYHKAVGYSFDSERIVTLTEKDGETSTQTVVRVPVVEHIPPSDTAAIFWLKNRRRKDWQERVESGAGDIKDLMEFSLKIGKAAGAIEERKRLASGAINGKAGKNGKAIAHADADDE